NFAFIGGEARYHTPRDDFAHSDPGSLQHHGDNALAMVRALAREDLGAHRGAEMVFFDVLALAIVRWPLRWMPLLAVAAALLLAPIVWLLYDALGIPILTGSAVLLTLVLATAGPAWIDAEPPLRRAVLIAASAVIVAGTIAAALAPPFSPDNPRKVNLWYRLNADSQQGAWLASADTGPLPPQLAAAAPFARTPVAALEWMPKLRAYPAPAPRMTFSPPELSVEDQRTTATGRMVRGRLVSPRGAPIAGFAVPRDRVLSVRMNGVFSPDVASKNLVAAPMTDATAWRSYVCTTTGASGVE